MAKNNITMTLSGEEIAISQLKSARVSLPGNVVYAVGTPIEYSIWQEIGTNFHPPQPYMRPAVRYAKRKVEKRTRQHDDLEDVIEALAKDVKEKAEEEVPVRTGTLKRSIEMERRK